MLMARYHEGVVKFEFPRPAAPEEPERIYHSFARYKGLEKALWAHARKWFPRRPTNWEDPALSVKQIAALIAHDKEAINDVRDFFAEKPHMDMDYEVANEFRENLAWALVDILSSPSE